MFTETINEDTETGKTGIDHTQTKDVHLRVDRLKLGVDGTHCPLCKDVLKIISNLFWNSGSTDSAWKFSKQTKPHFQYAHVKFADGAVIHLKFGQSHGQRKAFLQFNPAMIANASWHQLDHLIADFFPAGYGDLCAHGRVAEIDFACDVPQAHFHDFRFVDTRLQRCSTKFEAAGTLYIGSITGSRELRIYDKQAELNKDGIAHEEALLRIEASLLLKSVRTLNELVDDAAKQKLSNPFASLLVVSRAQLAAGYFEGLMGLFASRVAHGMTAQLAYRSLLTLPSKKVTMVKNGLAQLAPAWWSPATLWLQSAPALGAVSNGLVSDATSLMGPGGVGELTNVH